MVNNGYTREQCSRRRWNSKLISSTVYRVNSDVLHCNRNKNPVINLGVYTPIDGDLEKAWRKAWISLYSLVLFPSNILRFLALVNGTETEIVRQKCAAILRNGKPVRSNLSRSEFVSINAIRNNKEVLLLKVDKDNSYE